jgi:hypothetical protein
VHCSLGYVDNRGLSDESLRILLQLMSLVASGLFAAMVFFQKRKSKIATSVSVNHPSTIGDCTP